LYSEKFTVADDSGLVVPDLNFEPGIYSARYAGEGASDKENRDHLINKLNLIKKEELDAYYVCVLVGLRSVDDPMPIITHGEIHGKVSIKSSGDGGFGYDKVFYPLGYDCSMASIDSEIKNKISHRAIAFKKFIEKYSS
jgi:XTP/dITP diphosphohydrolase